jgi:hypothetical protein
VESVSLDDGQGFLLQVNAEVPGLDLKRAPAGAPVNQRPCSVGFLDR